MATIQNSSPEKIVSIKQFKGLNENRDGDTKLAVGEASVCLNWKVTRDGNLQRRPGQELVASLAESPIKGLWCGWVMGYEYILAACDGKLYMVYNGSTGTFPDPATEIGSLDTSGNVHIFGFDSKAYILNGVKYYEWNGTTLSEVVGYVPLVSIAIGPVGTAEEGGDLLEQVNKLTAERRVWISPDGTNKVFQLPEKAVSSIDYVLDLGTGSEVTTGWTGDTTNGTVTFDNAPVLGTNSYEIGYTASASYRSQVEAMKYAELYAGATDNRIFLYGDGTNELFYSDIDYLGAAHADYFPDLNEVAVGDANTPVTGLIRHFSRLICYKLDSTWSISASTLTTADGSMIASFNVIPVNRTIGNQAPGQVQLVLNSPRTLFQDELYEWKSSNAYSGNLTSDERQAYRISDRIYSTLRLFDFRTTTCYDDNANQEYYIVYNGVALVHNYAVNAWYMYDNFDALHMTSLHNELYFGDSNGDIIRVTERIKDDFDHDDPDVRKPIDARWESGSMSFGADYLRKYSSVLWVSVKPQTNSYVEISVITDRKQDFADKVIARGTSGFATWDFRSFSFTDNTQPQVKKLRLKAKKFQYYKLVFKSNVINTTATVLGADIKTRQTGYAK